MQNVKGIDKSMFSGVAFHARSYLYKTDLRAEPFQLYFSNRHM